MALVSAGSSAVIEAMSVEIGYPSKMAILEDAAKNPPVPSGPFVVLVDVNLTGMSGISLARQVRAQRLREALVLLIQHKRPSWLIEAHEPDGFRRAYMSLVDRLLQFKEVQPRVLLYVPHHWSGTRSELSDEDLRRARSLLDLVSDPAPRNTVQVQSARSAPLEAARERRAQLLTTELWLDSGKVHQQQQGGDPASPGANNTASRLRRKGELLGAWDGREYQHPAFQFDRNTGRVMYEMKELLELLPEDRSGWRQTFWLYQPHALLDGKRPADVFPDDPKSVIEAARSAFTPGNTNW